MQGFVHQKWLKDLFPLQKVLFLRRVFLTDLEGGGCPPYPFLIQGQAQEPERVRQLVLLSVCTCLPFEEGIFHLWIGGWLPNR